MIAVLCDGGPEALGIRSSRFPRPLSRECIDPLLEKIEKVPPAQEPIVHVGSVGAMLFVVVVIFADSMALQPVTVV